MYNFTDVNQHLLYVWLLAAVDAAGCAEEQILNCNLADTDDVAGFENEDEEPVAMNEESPSGSRLVSYFVARFLCFDCTLLQKWNIVAILLSICTFHQEEIETVH